MYVVIFGDKKQCEGKGEKEKKESSPNNVKFLCFISFLRY